MAFSDGTKRVLRLLISNWTSASAAESDPAEHRAFALPISLLENAIQRSDGTHEDIRRAISVCPGYPSHARWTLQELADAERDNKRVQITERSDGAIKWHIEG